MSYKDTKNSSGQRGYFMGWLFNTYCLGGLLIFAVGCSVDSVANATAAKNDSSIKRVVNLYDSFQRNHGYQGPKDEKALRSYVTEGGIPQKNIEMMGIKRDNLDALFISDRDGKPYKIRWDIMGGRGVSDALVFEDTGVNGKRSVAFNGPVVEEEDESRYKDLWEHGGPPAGMKSGGGLGAPPPANAK